jgi:hypothetical protein
MIASPDLEQLRQRVIASYHLGPLSGPETTAYVRHRLELAGWEQDPRLSEPAFDRIFEHSKGVPRTINVLCSRLLLYAYLEELHEIDGDAVDLVAEEYVRETRQITEMPAESGAEMAVPPDDAKLPTDGRAQGVPAVVDVATPAARTPAEDVAVTGPAVPPRDRPDPNQGQVGRRRIGRPGRWY